MTDLRCSVLVVDDDLGMRETCVTLLKHRCDVEAVESAEEAIELMERKMFHVLLSDIRLPGMNGIQLLGIVRKRWPSTQVIMISVINEVSVAVEAMRMGAYFYMTKDFDLEPLNGIVKAAMEHSSCGEIEALREANLRLRAELEELKSRLNVPANIADRRPTQMR